MPVIIVGAEKNLTALRPRLFSGRVTRAEAKEVNEAIREANPHADLDSLEPGTVLSVPDLPKVSVRGGLSVDEASLEVAGGLAKTGEATLAEVVKAAKRREKVLAAERKQVATALESKELDAAARKDKALGADLKAARRAVEDADAKAKERAAALEQARAEWKPALDELEKLLPQKLLPS